MQSHVCSMSYTSKHTTNVEAFRIPCRHTTNVEAFRIEARWRHTTNVEARWRHAVMLYHAGTLQMWGAFRVEAYCTTDVEAY